MKSDVQLQEFLRVPCVAGVPQGVGNVHQFPPQLRRCIVRSQLGRGRLDGGAQFDQ
ncbi:hypothetical protein AHiyo4_28750 [Arthrobacter sp. Hiyo4]|nr:hypothetical protein AHiyo4_28750 [Arthrobacter sp. Hiyo4]